MKKRVLSGIKPTGEPHIGNYFGMMKQLVDMQDEYETFAMIADYHALISVQNPEKMKEYILNIVIDYLAVGLNPEKVILFRQSDISAHTELTWIFNCLVTVPYLMRAHAYKDSLNKNIEPSVGLFDYPVLMATDILLYDPDIVPVGSDQKQHVEYARDIAQKFNSKFTETFKLPEEKIIEDVGTIPGTDGQKMSKSYGNTIRLFAADEEIEKAVASIPTDSKGVGEKKNPDEDNVFALHKLFSTADLDEIRKGYEDGGLSYKESKDILVGNIKKFIKPLREKRKNWESKKDIVLEILNEGTSRCREIADKKIEEVKEAIGVKL